MKNDKDIIAVIKSRRDVICGENVAYLTARFVAGADGFYQYQIPNGIGRNGDTSLRKGTTKQSGKRRIDCFGLAPSQ